MRTNSTRGSRKFLGRLAKVAQIDELEGRWIGCVNWSPQILGRPKQSVRITSLGASTRIEGARLSDEDVEKLIRGISIQKFADHDKQEVQGYYELLQNIFGSWKHIRFSEVTIKHFHKELLKHVEKDKLHRGEYKETRIKFTRWRVREGRSVGWTPEAGQGEVKEKEE